MRPHYLVGLLAIGVMVAAIAPAWADALISGTATYRERIALPPDAVFEAILEDVSRADAPSKEIARSRNESPGQPPIAFSIAYDPAAIEERFTYAVRARVVVGEQLMFTSDTLHRVLTRGAPSEVAIGMRMVGRQSAAPQMQRSAGAEGAIIPAPATADPATSPATSPGPVLGGMFVYMADAARLTDCRTGASHPVAMEADYLSLERAYLAARTEPGQALMVTVEGGIEQRPRMEGDGTEASVIVRRFINVWPGETCERNRADASLIGTDWRVVRLGGEAVGPAEGKREPHVILHADEKRFKATVGCNQMLGGYEVSGHTLRFGQAASTMMACPPPLDRLELKLAQVLTETASWHVYGQTLELAAADGRPLALLQAVYLR